MIESEVYRKVVEIRSARTQAILCGSEDALREAIAEAVQVSLKVHADYRGKALTHSPGCRCKMCLNVWPELNEAPWHGTLAGYGYHRCRCDKCKLEMSRINKERRDR